MKQCGHAITMTILNEYTKILFLDLHVFKYHTKILLTFMTRDLRAIFVGEMEKS